MKMLKTLTDKNQEKIEVSSSELTNYAHPFIALDTSFILFDSHDAYDGFGNPDLYISFKDKHGIGSKPQNLLLGKSGNHWRIKTGQKKGKGDNP